MKRSEAVMIGAAGIIGFLAVSEYLNRPNCQPQPGAPNQQQCSSSSSRSYFLSRSWGTSYSSSTRSSFFSGSGLSSVSNAVSSVTRGGFGSFGRAFGSFGG